jgi:hypothetical protein
VWAQAASIFARNQTMQAYAAVKDDVKIGGWPSNACTGPWRALVWVRASTPTNAWLRFNQKPLPLAQIATSANGQQHRLFKLLQNFFDD